MDVLTFSEEYNGLKLYRKVEFYRSIFEYFLTELKEEGQSMVLEEDILPILLEAESNDYFGTEGFKE